jgi:hypothetical protein
MDIGKFSCVPEVDLLTVAKQSNVENKAGDTSYRNCWVCDLGYSTVMFDRQRKLHVVSRLLWQSWQLTVFFVYLVYVPKLYFIVP